MDMVDFFMVNVSMQNIENVKIESMRPLILCLNVRWFIRKTPGKHLLP